jgi:branched-chain amino acid transport system permease protein
LQDIAGVLVNTVISAALYATMAYGLAVIYGVMRIINLAHAGLMMLGAYATFSLFTRFSLDPFLSLFAVGPLFFLIGVVLHRLVVRRLPRSGTTPSMESLLLLFGVWLVLQNLAYLIWTGDTQSILTSYTMKSVPVLGVRVGVPSLFVFLGVTPDSVRVEDAATNHSPRFFADESALPYGVQVMAGMAVDYLTAPRAKP